MSKELIEKLSDRVRPGSEAAPWVIEEIKRMEAELEAKAAPVGDDRGHDTKGSRKALGAMNAKLKAKIGRLERELAAYQREQQPLSADVVMPERKDEKSVHGAALMSAIAHNLCLDEFARLNGKEAV